jgi:hypothetical protein
MVPRPNFGGDTRNRKAPAPIIFENATKSETLSSKYVALMVDTLDKGGLEQVVAFLTQQLVKRGIAIKVLCTEKGREIANLLKQQGYEVYEFEKDRNQFDRFIKRTSASNQYALCQKHAGYTI